jgi:ParB-like chromosome segregation protein Spo0J
MKFRLNIEYVELSTLIPHVDNPKQHSPVEVAEMVESIKKWGWTKPMLVTMNGVIVDGHRRRLAALAMNITRVPVIRVPFTDEQALAFLMASKRSQSESDWNELFVERCLHRLNEVGYDMKTIGFAEVELRKYLGDAMCKKLKCPCCGGEIIDKRGRL